MLHWLQVLLSVTLIVGEFLFALSTYPLNFVLQWWQKWFGTQYELMQTVQQGGSSDADTSDVPTSFHR